MPRYFSYVTPDTRTRRLEEHTQREFQRKSRLDAVLKQKNDEIKAQTEQEQLRGLGLSMETEKARGLELDQVNTRTQFETEKTRGLELNERFSRIPEEARPTPEQRLARQGRLTPDPALGRQREPGIPSLVEDVFRQVGRVAGGPEEAFLPENVGGLAPRIPTALVSEENRNRTRYQELLEETRQSFPTRTPPGTTHESIALDRLNKELEDERAARITEARESRTPLPPEGAIAPIPSDRESLLSRGFRSLGDTGIFRERLTEGQRETLRGVPVVGPALEREVGFLSTPSGLGAALAFPTQIAAGAVGGVAAATTAQELGAGEDVQLAAQIAGNVLAPGGGIVPASVLTRPAGVAARTGRELVGEAATRARLAPEVGGGPLRAGEQGPLKTGIDKLTRALRLTTQRRTPLELQRTGQRIERVATERQMLDDLLAQGVPPQEAIPRARAAFKGEMAKAEGVLLDLTEAEQDAFWKVLTEHPLSFERQRGFESVMKLMAAESLQPNEVALLRRLYGDEFGDIAEAVGASQRQFLKELGEDFPRKIPAEKAPKPGDLNFPQVTGEPRIKPPLRRRILDEILELLKVRQVFMTVLDVSFGFRQAAKLGARNPKEWVKGMKWGFKTIRSEADGLAMDAAQRADSRIVTMVTPDGIEEIPFGRIQTESADILRPVPGTPAAEAAGVLEREESAITNKLSRLWGIKQSQQSFVVALNKMRGDVLWKWIKMAETQGRPITPEFVRDMGNLLNRMTGRGELGKNWIAKALKQLGFAPGYRISGPQTLMQLASRGKPHSAFIRRQAAENLAAWFGAGISLMGMAKATGAADALGLDPFSSDFGKIRIGPVRYNIWGTDTVLARHIAQFAWEKRRDPLTGESKVSMGDVFWRYVRSGADPNVGTAVDLATGKNFLGDPAGFDWPTLKREVESSFPLGLQDVKDILDEDGWIHSLAGIPFALGGVGISAYESERQRLAAAYNQHVEAGDFGPDAPLYKDVGTTVERRDNINKFDDLKGLSGELESTAITVRNDRSEELLKLAEAVIQGVPGAMRNYHENRSSIMTRFAGISESEFKDFNVTIKGADNEILSQVYDVDFLKDRDGNGIVGDDDDVRLAIEEQDKLKAQLSSGVQIALKNPENFFPDEDVVEVEKRRNAALDKVDFLFDNISKYQGATVKESEQTDEYARYVRQVQDNKLREFGDAWGWTLPELAIELGKEDGEEELGQWASWSLSGNIQRNGEYDQYLIDNQTIIAPVFPFMYNRTVFRESGVLTDAIFQEVNVPIQNPTEVGP